MGFCLVVARFARFVVGVHRALQGFGRNPHLSGELFPGVGTDRKVGVRIVDEHLHFFGIRTVNDRPGLFLLGHVVGQVREIFVNEALALLVHEHAVLVLVLRLDFLPAPKGGDSLGRAPARLEEGSR